MAWVNYPGLEDHPQHALMKRLLNPGQGFGGLCTIDLGSRDRANRPVRFLPENMWDGRPRTSWRMPGDGTGEAVTRGVAVADLDGDGDRAADLGGR